MKSHARWQSIGNVFATKYYTKMEDSPVMGKCIDRFSIIIQVSIIHTVFMSPQ